MKIFPRIILTATMLICSGGISGTWMAEAMPMMQSGADEKPQENRNRKEGH